MESEGKAIGMQMPGAAAMWRDVEERRMGRAWHLFYVFAAATAVMLCRLTWLAHHAVGLRNALRENHRVSQELWIPGVRGRIYAADGRLLAWSERHYRLAWQVPETLAEATATREECAQIAEIASLLPPLEQLPTWLGRKVSLDEELTLADDVLQSVLARMPESLSLQGYFIRRHAPEAAEAGLLGAVAVDEEHGLEYGVSGFEKRFDQQLRGRLVCLQVIADGRRAMVMNGKGRGEQGNGKDVYLGKVGP